MSVQVREKAPTFALPEAPGQMVDVGDVIGTAPVVLLFFPLAFSPVCTTEFCTFRDGWSAWESLGARVFGISIDSPFVSAKFKESENLPFPLLSDFNKEVAAMYGALHEDLMGLKGVAKRAAFVINREGEITYAWVSDDPGVQVNFDEIRAAVESA
jgi:peroxiredoxin